MGGLQCPYVCLVEGIGFQFPVDHLFAGAAFQVVEAFVLYGGGKVCLHYAVVELVEVFEKGNETVVDDVFGCLGVLYV